MEDGCVLRLSCAVVLLLRTGKSSVCGSIVVRQGKDGSCAAGRMTANVV